ncbi:MAG: hypothetical protein ACUVUC_15900 [Thermoguttaceae bacterium]
MDLLSGAAFQRQLARPVPGASWSNVPLRQAIRGISRATNVAILLDRRVDPDQRLSLTGTGLTVGQLLGRLAEDRRLGMTIPGPLVYLGPPQTSSRLRTVWLLAHQEAQKLPGPTRQKFLALGRLSWPDFAVPREILQDLAARSAVRIEGLEQIPHDLWAGVDLPPLSLVGRILVVAVQFDLSLEVPGDATGVRLVPIPEDVAIVKEYPAGARAHRVARQWAALVPDCQIEVVGDRIRVRGLLEDHERLSGQQAQVPHRRPPPPPSGWAHKRFTVNNAKGPLDRLLRDLASRLDLDFRIDQEALARAGISLSQEVSFSVREATIDELLEALLGPAGCTFQRRGNQVEVRPRSSPPAEPFEQPGFLRD